MENSQKTTIKKFLQTNLNEMIELWIIHEIS